MAAMTTFGKSHLHAKGCARRGRQPRSGSRGGGTMADDHAA
jgi:hypothetical protein